MLYRFEHSDSDGVLFIHLSMGTMALGDSAPVSVGHQKDAGACSQQGNDSLHNGAGFARARHAQQQRVVPGLQDPVQMPHISHMPLQLDCFVIWDARANYRQVP